MTEDQRKNLGVARTRWKVKMTGPIDLHSVGVEKHYHCMSDVEIR